MKELLTMWMLNKADKDAKEGTNKFSFKKVFLIMGAFSVAGFLFSLIIMICIFSFAKKQMNNMEKEWVMSTGTMKEKQLLLEPEELKSKYVDLYNESNLIEDVDDVVAEAMADYGLCYVAGGSDDIYVCSDGYFMYYLDIHEGFPSLFEIENDEGEIMSLNEFMKAKSK